MNISTLEISTSNSSTSHIRITLISVFIWVLMMAMSSTTYGQCTVGYTSGNLTLNSSCTVSSNITITGNLILNSGAQLSIAPGVVMTVTGHVQTGWKVGTVSISGGTLHVGTYLMNDDQTTLNLSGTTISTGTYFLNDYKSNMTITNSVINVGTYMHNEDQSSLVIDNSTIVVDGYVYNDFKANFELLNGSDMTINGSPSLGGNAFHNEDQTDFVVDNSSLTINGNVLNDFKGNLEVNNGGSMVVDGNFYNEDQATVSLTDGSLQVTGDLTNDFKSDIDVNSGGQMLVEGDVNSDPTSSIDVADGGSFCSNGTTSNPGTIHSASGDTDCSDGCCGGMITLPVELISFEGSMNSGKSTLVWKTATEINNDYFTIEKSTDGIIFYEVDKVSGNGNSEEELTYTWSEFNQTGGMIYYQLKQTDYDGEFEYLGVVALESTAGSKVEIYPNPVYQGSDITITGLSDQSVYTIKDIFGHQVKEGYFTYNNSISTHDLKTGIYILTINSGVATSTQKLIVK